MILAYFQRIILPYKLRKNFDKLLMVFDEATCHMHKKVIDFCALHSIYLLTIPPRMTNLLQPADVSWFASLKRSYRQLWNNWYVYDERTFTRNNNARSPGYVKCAQWLGRIWEEFESNAIIESFISTGVRSHHFDETTSELTVDTSPLHSCLRTILETQVLVHDYVSTDGDLIDLDFFANENDEKIFNDDDEGADEDIADLSMEVDENINDDNGELSREEQDMFNRVEATLDQELAMPSNQLQRMMDSPASPASSSATSSRPTSSSAISSRPTSSSATSSRPTSSVTADSATPATSFAATSRRTSLAAADEIIQSTASRTKTYLHEFGRTQVAKLVPVQEPTRVVLRPIENLQPLPIQTPAENQSKQTPVPVAAHQPAKRGRKKGSKNKKTLDRLAQQERENAATSSDSD